MLAKFPLHHALALPAPQQRNTKPLTYIMLLGQLAATSPVTANQQPRALARFMPRGETPRVPLPVGQDPTRRRGVKFPDRARSHSDTCQGRPHRSRSRIGPPFGRKEVLIDIQARNREFIILTSQEYRWSRIGPSEWLVSTSCRNSLPDILGELVSVHSCWGLHIFPRIYSSR